MQPDAGYDLSRVEQSGLMDGEGLEEVLNCKIAQRPKR